jgi:hypothetical protein
VIQQQRPGTWTAATPWSDPPTTSTPTLRPAPPSGVVISPSLVRVQMAFSLVSREMYGFWTTQFAGTPYNRLLFLDYTPIVTLHNPFNVALEFTDVRVEFANVPFAAKVWRNGVAMSTDLVPVNWMCVDTSKTTYKKFGMSLRTAGGPSGSVTIRLAPGEAKVFSPYLEPSTTFSTESTSEPFFDWRGEGLTENMIGVPGIRLGGYCLNHWVPDSMRTATYGASLGRVSGLIALQDTDQVKVEFAPLAPSNGPSKFVATLSIGGQAQAALEVNYETPTGLQVFQLGTGGTLTMPTAVGTAEMFESNTTQLRNYTRPKSFALFTLQAKTTADGSFCTKPWCFNAATVGASSQKLLTDHPAQHPHDISLQTVSGSWLGNTMGGIDAAGRSHFVTGNDLLTGRRNGILHEIPLAPVQTLAGLNGANPGGGSGYLPRFAQPIGNSWAHPLMRSENLLETKTGGNYLDPSFLLNLALYDGYFFSGLADQGGAFGTGKSTTTLAQSLAAGTPLDDPRLLLYRPDGRAAADFPGAVAATNAYSSIGAWLLQQGAFNINSTSVPAWKAMLASIHDADAIYNRLSVQFMPLTATTSLEARISRFRLPASHSAADGAVAKDAYWLGAREYSDAQLQTLAENIVAQIRLRGPFLSLAEFVNRRLGTDETAQRGALQQAIDDSNLNAPVAQAANAGLDISAEAVASYKYANPAAGTGASYQGAPGDLTQADLLNVLGNAASARSDTFTIRAYGEAHDQAGTPSATAVCEAVFQRLPDWVDPADPAVTAPAALTSQANRTQGRKFKLLAFRWLQPGEI